MFLLCSKILQWLPGLAYKALQDLSLSHNQFALTSSLILLSFVHYTLFLKKPGVVWFTLTFLFA